MKCPKCKASVTTAPDASGVIICQKCGARLRTRPATETVMMPASTVSASGAETLPPGKLKTVRAGSETLPPPGKTAARPGAETLAAPGAVAAKEGAAREEAATDEPPAPVSLEALFEELRAVRAAQDQILALLQERLGGEASAISSASPAASFGEDDTGPTPPLVRSRRRKTVLLIDDDPSSRIAALQALEHAEVPTRTAQDGAAGLAAIAEEKPDVIVLELGIDGAMSGKDVVNMVKATMEWVDVPIVLYTRVPIESQKEARLIHGADELVPKGADGANMLVARVIGLFRKG
jgi:CheY-like chemotaxis protein